MEAFVVINKRVKERGITVAELSRRVGVNAELLRRSLHGTRKIPADEFVLICVELGLGIQDFFSEDLDAREGSLFS